MESKQQMEKTAYQEFYLSVLAMIEEYKAQIDGYGFSLPEKRSLSLAGDGPEGTLAAIRVMMDSSLELNNIFENCPDSIYVVDAQGDTLRVSKAFNKYGNVTREEVIGRNVCDLEREGAYRPSVCALVIQEKRDVTILQEIKGGMKLVVTGVPIKDDKGEIYRIVSNAKSLEEFGNISAYVNQPKDIDPAELHKSPANGGIIVKSPAMKKIFSTLDKILDVDTTVLLMGESGVGKGVIARYIHLNGRRSAGRLVEINCGAIPETLLESELFGYESGAFTGADKKGKPGLIELADGGTLLLDEVSELPLLLQVKLLHFLQNRRLTRVGGTQEISVDTRVIAASNKDLGGLVKQGQFRSDLYYRLNVIPIEVPPLRKRLEDIEPAARHFIDLFNTKYGKDFIPEKEFINSLLRYIWPGNMRELENYIERVIVTSVQNEPPKEQEAASAVVSCELDEVMQAKTLEEALEQVEQKLVCSAYEKYGSSYKVAEALGISQPSAHRKILKYAKRSDQLPSNS